MALFAFSVSSIGTSIGNFDSLRSKGIGVVNPSSAGCNPIVRNQPMIDSAWIKLSAVNTVLIGSVLMTIEKFNSVGLPTTSTKPRAHCAHFNPMIVRFFLIFSFRHFRVQCAARSRTGGADSVKRP